MKIEDRHSQDGRIFSLLTFARSPGYLYDVDLTTFFFSTLLRTQGLMPFLLMSKDIVTRFHILTQFYGLAFFIGHLDTGLKKKSMFPEWPAEFIVYSRDKSKNFLLKKFLKILPPGHAHKQQR